MIEAKSVQLLGIALISVLFVANLQRILFVSLGSSPRSLKTRPKTFYSTSQRRICDDNGKPLAVISSPPALHDVTIELSRCVDRPWVGALGNATQNRQRPPPAYKLLITNFCWNHPDPLRGLNCTRSLRSRELLQGIVDHPYFDPVDWGEFNKRIARAYRNDSMSAIDLSTRYYVFLDTETCYAVNYPTYGGGMEANMDTIGGRVAQRQNVNFDCYRLPTCTRIQEVLSSPLFQISRLARLVFFDCKGNSNPPSHRQQLSTTQLALVSISASPEQLNVNVDQGLPAPAVTKISLNEEEVRDIETCQAESKRNYLFTFVGSIRNQARADLVKLHDPRSGVISLSVGGYKKRLASHEFMVNFSDMLRSSVFAAAPIGDNRFSYRFTEVLSAGAIPVVHSDGWVLPFRQELVNWTDCLLHLPQSTIGNTVSILRSISLQQRCRMRRRCREIYTSYMDNAEGIIRGIIDGLELVDVI
jgi:hypothetical protein